MKHHIRLEDNNSFLSILSLPRRKDRRNVAISSAIASRFPIKNVRFINAMDGADYDSIDSLLDASIRDGFTIFESLDKMSDTDKDCNAKSAIAYAWSICRYFRELADSNISEFFVHDDMHNVKWYIYDMDRRLMRNIFNYIVLGICRKHSKEFACWLLNNESTEKHKHGVVNGTSSLNFRAGYYSPFGASKILEQLKRNISKGYITPSAFLDGIESVTDWDQSGVFSTYEPFYISYPIGYLGSDIRNIPPLSSEHLNNIFSNPVPSGVSK